jgi:uncharacterized small protein (DUF1192 family)
MKLPEDKKERNKILALLGVGAVGGLYAMYTYGLGPIRHRIGSMQTDIERIEGELEKSDRQIRRAATEMTENRTILTNLLAATDETGYILRPRLGSYLLPATEAIEGLSRGLKVRIQSIEEVGVSALPRKGGPKRPTASALVAGKTTEGPKERERLFNYYEVTARLTGGMEGLRQLVAAIERSGPYLCVTGLDITGVEETPEEHSVVLNVQWPVWAKEAALDDLRRQAVEMDRHLRDRGAP